jgi:outer membrane usher protein
MGPPEAAIAAAPAPDPGVFGDGPIALYPERPARETSAASQAQPAEGPLQTVSTAPAPVRGPLGPATPAPAAHLTDDPANSVAQPQATIVNPFRRDIDVTMSLTYNNRDLGDLPVLLTRDNHVMVHSPEFIDLVSRLLSKQGLARITQALDGKPAFDPSTLRPIGITLLFDPSGLSVVILKIDPSIQPLQSLFDEGRVTRPTGAEPASFSAYINANAAAIWSQGEGVQPQIDLQGVIHYNHFVVESEFVGDTLGTQTGVFGATTDKFTFQRDYVRLVYDMPDQDLRFFAGDLAPEFRGEQGAVLIGGVGILRESQLYNPSRVSTLTNNQQFILNNSATIDVLRNGVLLQQLNLAAGSYNLNNLPLTTGSNNLQIQIHDASGVRSLNFSTYLDPIDIAPGDYEYGAYAGVLSTTTFQQPVYGNDPAFTGFFRKAFMNANAFGVGLQADKNLQMFDGEYRFVLPGGARVELGAAASHAANGSGGSVSAGYQLAVNRGGLTDDFEASVQYNSALFQVLGTGQANNTQEVTASGTYSHSFSEKLSAIADVYYAMERAPGKYSASADAQLQYEISRHWAVSFGIDYQANEAVNSHQRGLGAFFSLVWRPSTSERGELRYDGARETESASFTKSPDTYVGSYGYSGLVNNTDGSSNISGEVDYVGNRFTLDAAGGTSGTSFSNIGASPNASVRVGTSIGYVDGHFGIGRPISNSFVLVYPHASLDGKSVIVGDDLQQGHVDAASGPLGAALYPFLSAYSDNSVRYDVAKAPLGYDIGAGVFNMRPTYRSGYALQVGSEAYVSATGTLIGFDNKPVVLVAGHVISVDEPKAAPQFFFTNSSGRFALQGLKPGRRYRVEVDGVEPMSFVFETPKKGVALVNLRTVKGHPTGQ